MNEKPSTDEQYASATNARKLTFTNSRGHGDLLVAAGWSHSRTGMALLRLVAEWDSAAHPRRGSPADPHELGLLMGKLKTLPEVRHQLTLQAHKWKLKEPLPIVAAVLVWWLDKACQQCHGAGLFQVPGTQAVSCKGCRGSGHARLPHGDAGRKLANYIDDCLSSARQSLGKRL